CEDGATLFLIRPLLDVSREEVLRFLHERRIAYRADSTNSDLSYLRNWTRLHLMPQLKEKFGRQLSLRLSDQGEVMRAEETYLNTLSCRELEKISTRDTVNRACLLGLGKALQRRVLRLWIEQRRGHLRGIDFDHIETALNFIAAGPSQGSLAFPGGWALVREYETLRFANRLRYVRRQCYSYRLQPGMELDVSEAGLVIDSRVVSALPQSPESLMEAVFDAALVPGELTVRNFRNGDRMQPLGLNGHKKIKDLFIEKKLPLSIRAITPLLTTGKEILWIPGCGRSEVAKVSPATKAFLCFTAHPANN
ncbi:MAG: tRNA lysidine(34) synthetase TilS, partial [Candidatus Binatia bacterium]